MRAFLLSLALAAAAAPAIAQVTPLELENLRAQQEAAQRRAIDLANQLMAQEARQRADRAVADLQLQQRFPARVPQAPYVPGERSPRGAAAAVYPSIPDEALAESDRRVRAAAENRR